MSGALQAEVRASCGWVDGQRGVGWRAMGAMGSYGFVLSLCSCFAGSSSLRIHVLIVRRIGSGGGS